MALTQEGVKFSDFVRGLPAASESDLAAGNNMPLVRTDDVKKLPANFVVGNIRLNDLAGFSSDLTGTRLVNFPYTGTKGDYILNTTGVFTRSSGGTSGKQRYSLLNCSSYHRVLVEAGSNGASIAFLRDDVFAYDVLPNYAGGYTNLIELLPNTAMVFDVPSDANLIYIYCVTGAGTDITPKCVSFSDLRVLNDVVFSLRGTTSYSQLAEFYEVQETGDYDIFYSVVDGEFTLHLTNTTNNAFTMMAVDKNGVEKWLDNVAIGGAYTRLYERNKTEKVYLEKGWKIVAKGRISCKLSFSICKHGQDKSVLSKLADSLTFQPLNELMERGGIFIQSSTGKWEYNDESDTYYYSRIRTRRDSTLLLNPGDKIHCEDWSKFRVYVGWKKDGSTTISNSSWLTADFTATETAHYVFQATLVPEADFASDEAASEAMAQFSVIRTASSKNFAERLYDAEKGIESLQPPAVKSTAYQGERLPVDHIIKVSEIGNVNVDGLDVAGNGLAIFGNYLVDLFHTGIAKIYSISNNFKLTLLSGSVQLGSYSLTENHANCGSFGNYHTAGDFLPLLYVSQYMDGRRNSCFVERIGADFRSTLVQTINPPSDVNWFGYSVDYTIDRERQKLVLFGNTISSSNASNKHRIMEFDIPNTSDSVVNLVRSNATQSYIMEDESSEIMTVDADGRNVFSIQGCFARNGYLFCLASGAETEENTRPKIIYVWDLVNKRLHSKIQLNGVIGGELEDFDYFNGAIVLKSGYGLNKFFKIETN